MKRTIITLLTACVLAACAGAQESAPAATNPPAITEPSKSGLLNPEASNEYARLKLEEARIEARLKLLNELAEEHQKRAETAKGDKPDLEKWEIANAQELKTRAFIVSRDLNEVTRQRLAFEESHIAPIVTLLGPGSLEPSGALNPYELAFVLRLEKRLSTVTGELLATVESSRNYTLQLGTNRVPEDIDRITLLLNESSRQVRELEKEQADLELRKLEFRALRR